MCGRSSGSKSVESDLDFRFLHLISFRSPLQRQRAGRSSRSLTGRSVRIKWNGAVADHGRTPNI
uniref:Uncharacterized protein n=1 Tax=Triticum urartu TaxID=4572 RepID=A0A8R7UFU3_TRIUA